MSGPGRMPPGKTEWLLPKLGAITWGNNPTGIGATGSATWDRRAT
jgi:hypothetical protein